MNAPRPEEFFDWVEGVVRERFASGHVSEETPKMFAFGSKGELQPLEPPITAKYRGILIRELLELERVVAVGFIEEERGAIVASLYTRDDVPRAMAIEIEGVGTGRRLGKLHRDYNQASDDLPPIVDVTDEEAGTFIGIVGAGPVSQRVTGPMPQFSEVFEDVTREEAGKAFGIVGVKPKLK